MLTALGEHAHAKPWAWHARAEVIVSGLTACGGAQRRQTCGRDSDPDCELNHAKSEEPMLK